MGGKYGPYGPSPSFGDSPARHPILLQAVTVDGGASPEGTDTSALYDALAAMSTDLELGSTLQRLVDSAATLTDASYGALRVVDPDGNLVDLITVGLEREAPTSFIGLEVRARGTGFGNLCLADKRGGEPFSDSDERLLQTLAIAAGLLIDNARSHELSEARGHWLEASAAITRSLVGTDLDPAFQQVADLARDVSGASTACVALLSADRFLEVRVVSGVSTWSAGVEPISIDGSIAGVAIDGGEPLVIPEVSEHPAAPALIRSIGRTPTGPAAMLPLRTPEGTAGLLLLAWDKTATAAFRGFDLGLASGFAEQAALALEVSRARSADARRSLTEDRDRIARDLHDVVIQRLFAIGMQLDHAATTLADGPIADLMSRAVDDLDLSIKDIRTSIFKLQNAQSGSLRAGVLKLVEEYAGLLGFAPSVAVRGPVDQSVSATCRDDVLAVLREALSNVMRHAAASAAEVSVEVTATHLTLTVSDDGRGLPPGRSESGLNNARARAAARGGKLLLGQREPRGTEFVWTVRLD